MSFGDPFQGIPTTPADCILRTMRVSQICQFNARFQPACALETLAKDLQPASTGLTGDHGARDRTRGSFRGTDFHLASPSLDGNMEVKSLVFQEVTAPGDFRPPNSLRKLRIALRSVD